MFSLQLTGSVCSATGVKRQDSKRSHEPTGASGQEDLVLISITGNAERKSKGRNEANLVQRSISIAHFLMKLLGLDG